MPQTLYQYKGFTIKLKFAFTRGGGYQILKIIKGKAFICKDRSFTFIRPQKAIDRATEDIEKRVDELNEKFKTQFIAFCEKVAANPNGYGGTPQLDVIYFLKCHKKLQDGK